MGFFWIRIFLAAGGLLGQDFSEIQFERNAVGHRFADSPLWSPAVAGLLFADVPNNTIHAFLPGKGVGKYKVDLNGPSGLALDAEGRLIVAESRGRRLLRFPLDERKAPEVLAERFEGKRLNAPNDVVVRKDGQIYFTDPAFGNQQDSRELDFHGIYHLSPKAELSLVAKWKGRPNGIALSPNGKLLYVTDADERRIVVFDLDGRGKASGERVVVAKTEGIPAGLESDEKGNLYVAENSLRVYNPSGKVIGTLLLSEKPTNVTFGDPDGLSLYITGPSGLFRARVKVGGAGFTGKSSEATANDR